MENFNKYNFLDSVKNTILDAIKNGEITDISEIWAYQNDEIENACIYYSDCFDICKALNFTEWSNSDLGEITNITQAACVALHVLLNDEFNDEEILELLETV
jgi:hypothetical protein